MILLNDDVDVDVAVVVIDTMTKDSVMMMHLMIDLKMLSYYDDDVVVDDDVNDIPQ